MKGLYLGPGINRSSTSPLSYKASNRKDSDIKFISVFICDTRSKCQGVGEVWGMTICGSNTKWEPSQMLFADTILLEEFEKKLQSLVDKFGRV